jgi:hypothetical protein
MQRARQSVLSPVFIERRAPARRAAAVVRSDEAFALLFKTVTSILASAEREEG